MDVMDPKIIGCVFVVYKLQVEVGLPDVTCVAKCIHIYTHMYVHTYIT